jgi:hypothetical protein
MVVKLISSSGFLVPRSSRLTRKERVQGKQNSFQIKHTTGMIVAAKRKFISGKSQKLIIQTAS